MEVGALNRGPLGKPRKVTFAMEGNPVTGCRHSDAELVCLPYSVSPSTLSLQRHYLLIQEHALSAYYVADTVLGAQNTAVTKQTF